MAKTKKINKKKGVKKPGQQVKESVDSKEIHTSDPEGEQDAFDFGGLPSRDLKKNLGCG